MFSETQIFVLTNNLRCFDGTDVCTSQKTTYAQLKIYRTNFIDEIGPWSHFIQDKLKISIYLSLDKYKCIKLIKKIVFHILISYYEFTCCIENSVDPDQLASSKAS